MPGSERPCEWFPEFTCDEQCRHLGCGAQGLLIHMQSMGVPQVEIGGSPHFIPERSMNTQSSPPKHTPGPWIVNVGEVPSLGGDALGVIRESHTEGEVEPSICIVAKMDRLDAFDEANARLIAAAPDLLERLRGLMHRLETIRETDKTGLCLDRDIESARAVIERATCVQNAD